MKGKAAAFATSVAPLGVHAASRGRRARYEPPH